MPIRKNWNKIIDQLVMENCLVFGDDSKLTQKSVARYLLGTRATFEIFKLYELRYLLLKVYPFIQHLFYNPRRNPTLKTEKRWNSNYQKQVETQRKLGTRLPSKEWKPRVRIINSFLQKDKNLIPQVLFATVTPMYTDIVRAAAKICNMPSHENRWLSGSITAAISYQEDHERWNYITDKTQVQTVFSSTQKWGSNKENPEKTKEKLKFYGESRWPSLIIIPDISNNIMILKEAKKVGIPIMGLVNSSTSFQIDYPIFAQEQSIQSVHFFCHFLATLIAKEIVYVQHKRNLLIKKKQKLKHKNAFQNKLFESKSAYSLASKHLRKPFWKNTVFFRIVRPTNRRKISDRDWYAEYRTLKSQGLYRGIRIHSRYSRKFRFFKADLLQTVWQNQQKTSKRAFRKKLSLAFITNSKNKFIKSLKITKKDIKKFRPKWTYTTMTNYTLKNKYSIFNQSVSSKYIKKNTAKKIKIRILVKNSKQFQIKNKFHSKWTYISVKNYTFKNKCTVFNYKKTKKLRSKIKINNKSMKNSKVKLKKRFLKNQFFYKQKLWTLENAIKLRRTSSKQLSKFGRLFKIIGRYLIKNSKQLKTNNKKDLIIRKQKYLSWMFNMQKLVRMQSNTILMFKYLQSETLKKRFGLKKKSFLTISDQRKLWKNIHNFLIFNKMKNLQIKRKILRFQKAKFHTGFKNYYAITLKQWQQVTRFQGLRFKFNILLNFIGYKTRLAERRYYDAHPAEWKIEKARRYKARMLNNSSKKRESLPQRESKVPQKNKKTWAQWTEKNTFGNIQKPDAYRKPQANTYQKQKLDVYKDQKQQPIYLNHGQFLKNTSAARKKKI